MWMTCVHRWRKSCKLIWPCEEVVGSRFVGRVVYIVSRQAGLVDLDVPMASAV